MDERANVSHFEQVHREDLLVEALEYDRVQLHIIIKPTVTLLLLVLSDEIRVSDEAYSYREPLGKQPTRLSNDL